MAYCYKLTAPRSMGKIPKGFVLQVASCCTARPNSDEVRTALMAAGFTDQSSLGYCSSGNWKVEQVKL